jgi:hypothetical protein
LQDDFDEGMEEEAKEFVAEITGTGPENVSPLPEILAMQCTAATALACPQRVGTARSGS